MATEAPVAPTVLPRVRLVGLDRLRGLAVLLMVADHLLLVFGGPVLLRETVTRAAMPLFFVIAGHLVRRLHWSRLAVCFALGLALPVVVPWIDNPNVLLLYVLGAVVVVYLRDLDPRWTWVFLVVMVTAEANGMGGWAPGTHAYHLPAMVALMLAGSLWPSLPTLGGRLPAWLARCGRFPLTVYVGHLLALQLVVVGLGW